MIYLVSNQASLFETPLYGYITVEDSIKIIESWKVIQYDSETGGLDPYTKPLLSAQFGNDKADIQIVVDCTTIDIRLYKHALETIPLVGHNIGFDLKFLYKYGIVPIHVYDTMIVEQLLYLGFPSGLTVTSEEYTKWEHTFPYHIITNTDNGPIYYRLSYALNAVAKKRLNIDIDKTIRGQIIYKGLTPDVVVYGAGDVMYLEKIMWSQIEDCKKKDCMIAAQLECDCVPATAYMEYCGIKLDTDKWSKKMEKDSYNAFISEDRLNRFVIENDLKQFYTVSNQIDLFSGYSGAKQCTINWSSPKQVVSLCKVLGFDTRVVSKTTGEEADSALEKVLKVQKGINDEFLKLYFDYKEASKVVSSFGAGHLNSINPVSGRLHTNFKQLGAASGRFSCGGGYNEELARLKQLPAKSCINANLQQLPHDEVTRACFVAPKGYKFVSCDYHAEEAQLAGDIYKDDAILEMFRKGLDSHSVYAKIFFKEDLADIDVNDVKKLRPDLRTLAKGPEFALNFGGGKTAIMQAIGCSEQTADTIIHNYEEGFKGTAEFARKGSAFVRKNGYIVINPETGHKMYWWDHKAWLADEQEYRMPGFWDDYKSYHKPLKDAVYDNVKMHMKAGGKWDRLARNAPTQGTGACIMKRALTNLFRWIIANNYFDVIHICVAVHDKVLSWVNYVNCWKLLKTNILHNY